MARWWTGWKRSAKTSTAGSRQIASQFSREYSRFFGSAPARDIAKLLHEGGFLSGAVQAN